MTKEKRTRRLCASLALTVLASTTILTGMAPVVAHAEGETPGEATSSVLVTPSLDGAATDSESAVDLPVIGDDDEGETSADLEEEIETEVEANMPGAETSMSDEASITDNQPAPTSDDATVDVAAEISQDEKAGAPISAQGTWGTVDWTLTNEGELILHGGKGVDTDGESPWEEFSREIEQVIFLDTVYAPDDSSSLFSEFYQVTDFINIELLDTSNVVSMGSMFYATTQLSSLDVSNFDVSNVKSMYWMFGFSGVDSFDLSSWQFNSEVDLDRMFARTDLTEVNFGNAVFADPQEPFEARDSSVDKLVLGSQTRLANVPIKDGMQWEGTTKGHTFFDNYAGGYADTYTLTPAPRSGTWGTVAWTVDEDGTLSLEGGAGLDTELRSPWWVFGSLITRIVLNGQIEAPRDSSYLFAYLDGLTEIEHLDRLDVSQVEDISGMFTYNSSLETVEAENWNTAKVEQMAWLFDGCESLTEIRINSWDVSSVRSMHSVFSGTSSLTQLDLSNWQVDNLSDMSNFLSQSGVGEVDLSNWNGKEVYASNSFIDMPALKRLDITGLKFYPSSAPELINEVNQLEILVINDENYLDRFWAPAGQVWTGEKTGHQFGLQYNGGFGDTYRLQDGALGYLGIWFDDHTLGEDRGEGGVLYGEIGATADLSQINLPDGYELVDPNEKLTLAPLDEDGEIEYQAIGIKQIPKITTRRITFTGLPAGMLKDVVQKVQWHWNWYGPDEEDEEISRDYDEYLAYLPQNHYEAYSVPSVPGYKAEVTTVAAQTIDTSEPITELVNAEDVTVHYTKLANDGGNASNGGTNIGNKNKDAYGSLPQTGSVAANGLAALGIGLLGLLGINWRKRHRS
ncbi:BspA family leucine-rich repeat surface protein [Lacticaseibacillus suibinensis]|uniref:BspA family leucine-rich repeat surface protein n=1 Tax=Lacticaseibacillus suibinensis TaxID=2486011 RepID=UPI0013DD9656|nr:BspA family leucine-rich repeat surface protein [Lacticaseibacillus suibinensis]